MSSQRDVARSIFVEWQSWVVLMIAAIAVTPTFLLGSLYFVAFRAAVRVGHWPYPGNPDASAMGEDLQPWSGPFSLLVPLAIYLTSAILLAAFVLRYSELRRCIPFSIAIGSFTWVLLAVIFYLDPACVWQWIMD
jgi:hypothetical protein